MLQKETIKYYAPVIFFLLLLFDGQLTGFMDIWGHNNYFAVSHLLLIVLMLSAVNLPKSYMLPASLILGFLYDTYYVGIIGIYMVTFFLLTLLIYQLNETINTNVFTMFFGMIIFVTLFEICSLFLQVVFQLTDVNVVLFISRVLGPTLLLNVVLFFILIYPLRKLFVIK